MPIRSRKLNIIACVSAMQLMPAIAEPHRGAQMGDFFDDVLVAARRRRRERDHRGDAATAMIAGEGPEEHRAAEGCDQVGRCPEKDDRKDTERHADDGEEPMRIGAVGDRAVGEAQRAAD